MSYPRTQSPSGRRTVDPRFSDAVADAYHSHRHNSSVLPRSSADRVIPLSTQTYITSAAPSSSAASRYSASDYVGRARRSSNSTRARPSIDQGDGVRSMSPLRDDRRYYATTASSKDARDVRGAKKVYATSSGGARLISESEVRPEDTSSAHNRHYRQHRRQDSEDRAYREPDRYSRTSTVPRKEKSIDDEDAFSYTDAAAMYRETQPSWRERDSRPRRGSLDRHGGSRERPTSMVEPMAAGSRKSREIGPPPSQRGWDRINEGIGRTKSMRDGPREVERSPQRGRDDQNSSQDPYYSAPRRESQDRSRRTRHEYRTDKLDAYESDVTREPQHRERRLNTHKAKDRSVSRRGFGIRPDSQERQAQRVSDESLGSHTHDDPPYDIRRRDVASDNEHTGKHRRHHRHDSIGQDGDRYDRGYDKVPRDDDDRPRRRRDKDDTRERRYREDSRDRGADTAQAPDGSAHKVAGGLAAGAGAAALLGLSKSRGGEDEHDRKRNSDDSRARLEPRRDDIHDRRRSARPGDVPYPDHHLDGDRGLGFAFEAPSAASDKSRLDLANTSRDASRDNQRRLERAHEDVPPALSDNPPVDPDEEYRRRIQLAQRELGQLPSRPADDADRERRRRERELRMQHRREPLPSGDSMGGAMLDDRSPLRSSFDSEAPPESSAGAPSSVARPGLQRRASVVDDPMPPGAGAVILDNSQSEQRETKVRIVDPPTEEEERRPKSILKRPTQKFPEDPIAMREGVAPLKDSTKKGIPPGARWTKIDRRLVNPEALEEAKERYEERLDCVIVLRVLTKEEVQKLADRTKALREKRFAEEGRAERHASRRNDRERDRRDRDEYSDDGLEEWERDDQRPLRMLEAPPSTSDHNDRHRER